jgi:MscS family membrane protein
MNWNIINTWLKLQGFENLFYRQVIEVAVIFLLTAIVSFVVGRVFSQIENQLSKTRNLWDDTILHAARGPVLLAIWLLGISWLAYSIQRQHSSDISDIFFYAQRSTVIFCLTWFVIRFIGGVEHIVISAEKMKEPMDETTVFAVGKLLKAACVFVAVLVILQTTGYSISGVLAFGGVGGIAIGFAAKDLLANFFGGLMIYLDRPFKVGDWIRSPDKEIEGTVVKIGWRLTTITTFDKRPLYVPNSFFTTISVQNPSRMSHRRIFETIGVRYCDAAKLPVIIDNVKSMLTDHPEIDNTQTMIVNFTTFNNSSLDFFIYTFTKTTNWIKFHEVKQDVLLRILDIIEEQKAEVAFPTSTLHFADMLRVEGVVDSNVGSGQTFHEK